MSAPPSEGDHPHHADHRGRRREAPARLWFRQDPDFDPFLLFDDFRNDNPADYLAGFPWHPHRGIETITYVLAGSVEHGDSLGNRGSWRGRRPVDDRGQRHPASGDAQGRRAAAGCTASSSGRICPSSLKMTDPRYQDIPASAIPEVTDDDGTRVRVICGEFWGKRGPVEGVAADPRYLDISVPPGKRKTPQGRDRRATLRLRVRGLGHVPRRFRPQAVLTESGRADRERRAAIRRQQPLAGAVRPGRRGHGAGRRRGHPLPAGLGQADRGAGRLVRADRDEHAGRAAAGGQRTAERAPSSSTASRFSLHIAGRATRSARSSAHCSFLHRSMLLVNNDRRPGRPFHDPCSVGASRQP